MALGVGTSKASVAKWHNSAKAATKAAGPQQSPESCGMRSPFGGFPCFPALAIEWLPMILSVPFAGQRQPFASSEKPLAAARSQSCPTCAQQLWASATQTSSFQSPSVVSNVFHRGGCTDPGKMSCDLEASKFHQNPEGNLAGHLIIQLYGLAEARLLPSSRSSFKPIDTARNHPPHGNSTRRKLRKRSV